MKLAQHPEQFELFQALRLLDQLLFSAQEGQPEIRLSTTSSLKFSASSLGPITQDSEQGSSVLTAEINIFGLTGSSGALPFHYSELLQQRLRLRDETLKAFFDLFNHRLLQIYHQTWRKYRLPLTYEHHHRQLLHQGQQQHRSSDPFSLCLASLAGLGTNKLDSVLPFPKEDMLGMAGILSRPIRSAIAIERLLRYYFELPITIRQFQGEWLDIPIDIQTRLPSPDQPLGMNCELGNNVIIGDRGWQVQSKFSVVISDISYSQLTQLQSGSPTMTRLRTLVAFMIHDEYDFDVVITIDAHAIPPLVLDNNSATPPLLGWTSALGVERHDEHFVIVASH